MRTTWQPDPVADASLMMWIDPKDPSMVTLNGARCSSIADKSVEGNDILQASASDQPWWSNDNRMIYVDDHEEMKTGVVTGWPTTDCTIYMVQRNDTLSLDSYQFETEDPSTHSMQINAHLPWNDGDAYFDFGDVDGDGRLQYAYGEAQGTLNAFALTVKQNEYMRVYTNGALSAEKLGATSVFVPSATQTMELYYHSRGYFGDFLMFSRPHTIGEIQFYLEWLRRKYKDAL